MGSRLVGLNELNLRIGEDHGRARLTNADVERILQLHASGIGYKRLAKMFECGRTTVRDIVNGRCRTQTPTAWKRCETKRSKVNFEKPVPEPTKEDWVLSFWGRFKRLTWLDVAEMDKRYRAGESLKVIAEDYLVNASTVGDRIRQYRKRLDRGA